MPAVARAFFIPQEGPGNEVAGKVDPVTVKKHVTEALKPDIPISV